MMSGKSSTVTRYLASPLLLLFLLAPACAQPHWPPQTFSAYYGEIEPDTPAKLADFDLLIVHPGDDLGNLDPDKVARLRGAGRPKTLVGYVSIGEEDVSPGGPPLQGQDTTGPSFVGKDLRPAMAGNSYPAYFMDQRKVLLGPDGFPRFGPNGKPLEEKGQDGHPDENGVWGSYYAKADDPVWRARVYQRLEHLDKLGLDGFFLDTVDTASPWGDYGWTAPGMLDLVEQIRARYPAKKIIANRGLFYLDQSDRYAKAIDAVLFESLLTNYSEETKSADVSQWARWHVQALQDQVIPAQKRTGLTLLVLDYLAPDHPDAPLLIQSARTLLASAPQSSLSFSHPLLRIPGWPADSLLAESVPATWPAVKSLQVVEGERGELTLEAAFDSPIPEGAVADLRVTSRDDVTAERAAELPLASVTSFEPRGDRARLSASGLDKETSYKLFFRLISKSRASQPAFSSTAFKTRPSDLPAQVTDLVSNSAKDGLVLSFSTPATASAFRIYSQSEDGSRKLLREAASSPVVLEQPAIDSAVRLVVAALDAQGREGYPSQPHLAVRRNVVAAPSPGPVSVSGDAGLATFRWDAVPEVSSYRLYVIPEGQKYRLPLVLDGPEAEVQGVRPGSYRVFATTVDGDGNQSGPGPTVLWKAE